MVRFRKGLVEVWKAFALFIDISWTFIVSDYSFVDIDPLTFRDSVNWQTGEERRAFEEQLTQLQEQLMEVMIENQSLRELNQTLVLSGHDREKNYIFKSCLKFNQLI